MKKMVLLCILGCLAGPTLVIGGCASSQHETIGQAVDAPLVGEKYSLQKDREAYADLRNQVPENKRHENDEIAFIMQWMGEVKMPPQEVRDKFQKAISKKRELLQKDLTVSREQFVRQERLERENKIKDLESQRQEFLKEKPDRDETKRFFTEQDRQRKDFFSTQREKRDAFEADQRDQRKNFDDYVRAKNQEFNQELRAYTQRFEDWKKQQNSNGEPQHK